MSASKRCIVFAVDKPNDDGLDECVEFYAFDEDFIQVENEQGESLDKARYGIKIKDPSQIARPLSRQNHCHVFATYAFLGRRVYCAGGDSSRCEKCKPLLGAGYLSKSVDRWDAINNCCTSLPPMNLGRKLLGLHILQGKLYAIGGYPSNDKFVFIERLDEGCWTPLPYPPPTVELDCNKFVSAVIEREGFILFGSRACKSFYAYTPPETWRRMDHLPFNPKMLNQRLYSLAVVDNHLLWLDGYCGSTLIGFDVDVGRYFAIDLASEGLLPSREFLFYLPHLVHVGNGVLALVWSDGSLCLREGQGKAKVGERYNLNDAFSGFHCSRFSIDFVRAHAGEKKCCMLVSHQRCFGPKSSQTLKAAFVADVAVPVGNPSDSNIDSILPRQKRARIGLCL